MKDSLLPWLLLSIAVCYTFALFFIGALFFQKSQSQTQAKAVITPTVTPSLPPAKKITVDQVKTHTTKENCWVILHDAVYDFSSLTAQYPDITKNCGQDATALFESLLKTYGVQYMGVANGMLTKYYLGDLQK